MQREDLIHEYLVKGLRWSSWLTQLLKWLPCFLAMRPSEAHSQQISGVQQRTICRGHHAAHEHLDGASRAAAAWCPLTHTSLFPTPPHPGNYCSTLSSCKCHFENNFFALNPGIWKFLGQGLNPGFSCSNTGSFKLLCWARDQTHTSAVT